MHDLQLLTGAAAAGPSKPHNKYYKKAWSRSRSQVEQHVHNHPPICRKETPDQSTFRSTSLESEVDREHSEMVVNSHAHKHERKHHHRHHHHHKHRSHNESDRHGRSRYWFTSICTPDLRRMNPTKKCVNLCCAMFRSYFDLNTQTWKIWKCFSAQGKALKVPRSAKNDVN